MNSSTGRSRDRRWTGGGMAWSERCQVRGRCFVAALSVWGGGARSSEKLVPLIESLVLRVGGGGE